MHLKFKFLFFFLLSIKTFSQYTITGQFPSLYNRQVKLVGFQDFGTYTIDSTVVSKEGEFILNFKKNDLGMSYLLANDHTPYFVVLAEENFKLKGESFSNPETVKTLIGKENSLFAQFAAEHPRRMQAMNAWKYLDKIYSEDSLFSAQTHAKNIIENERERLEAEDSLFLEKLDEESYLYWYLPLRKFISSIPFVAQRHPKDIPAVLKYFREMDYTDARLYKSGLLKDIFTKHFWLIENNGQPLESINREINTSIDFIIENLSSDKKRLNEITNFLFNYLEERSLFKSSEYLALKVLDQDEKHIDQKLKSKLETYRVMKVGKTAPDFDFQGDVFFPNYSVDNFPKKLSDLKAEYTVLIFGSSVCPACAQELSEVVKFYKDWNKQKVEVVFISLDENKNIFRKFIKIFPFISMNDFHQWDSPIVKDYHVFATPTIFLLNKNKEILLRPHSVAQVNSWINWFLIQGNK